MVSSLMYSLNPNTRVPLLDRSAPFMEDIVVTKEGVTKLLKGLNPSKALGPDELHPRVLKELATELGPIFTHLFQLSIDSGDIPKEWTLANISPLFKKGDRSLACYYRPVSLTCVPCKLLLPSAQINFFTGTLRPRIDTHLGPFTKLFCLCDKFSFKSKIVQTYLNYINDNYKLRDCYNKITQPIPSTKRKRKPLRTEAT